jgi:hypothetical protein
MVVERKTMDQRKRRGRRKKKKTVHARKRELARG